MTAIHVSDALAHHVACTPFSQLTAPVVAVTKRSLLDGIGVMLAASGLCAEANPFVELACATSAPGRASILGHEAQVSAAAAAFANGAMAHALDYEDAFDPAPTHPNASLIPAAIAIAQDAATVDGETFLTAMAIGCDLTCRLGLSAGNGLEEGGWYPPPILGAFGAAAAAARLLALTPRQVSDAFSLLLCQTACPGEIKYTTTSPIRAVREAFAAQAAVQAVLLAKRGIAGFSQPFEGRGGFFKLFAAGRFDEHALLDGLGTRFHGERVSFKPWPCCRGTHAYIQAARELRQRFALHWREIAYVTLTVGSVQRMLCEPIEQKRAPSSAIDAKFSLPFAVASALIQPDVTLDSFSPAALVDEDALTLARAIRYETRTDWGREHAAAGALEIGMRDGRVLAHAVGQAVGHPDAPLDEATLRAKFIDCATRAAHPCTEIQANDFARRVADFAAVGDAGAALRIPTGA
jgi:2-methylcitrate dehydratase PrpD